VAAGFDLSLCAVMLGLGRETEECEIEAFISSFFGEEKTGSCLIT